jgi:hypothetical protein
VRAADQQKGTGKTTASGRRPDPAEIARQLKVGHRSPVHKWEPEMRGESGMRIARDGTWTYRDSPIQRSRMVALFSSVLRREGDGYYLVTPVEKLSIEVEDAPFVAVEMTVHGEAEDQVLVFRTNVGEEVMAGPEHGLRFEVDPESEEPAPYLHVRDRLEALIARTVFYDLVDLAVAREMEGRTWLGIWSAGAFFPLGLADELDAC